MLKVLATLVLPAKVLAVVMLAATMAASLEATAVATEAVLSAPLLEVAVEVEVAVTVLGAAKGVPIQVGRTVPVAPVTLKAVSSTKVSLTNALAWPKAVSLRWLLAGSVRWAATLTAVNCSKARETVFLTASPLQSAEANPHASQTVSS